MDLPESKVKVKVELVAVRADPARRSPPARLSLTAGMRGGLPTVCPKTTPKTRAAGTGTVSPSRRKSTFSGLVELTTPARKSSPEPSRLATTSRSCSVCRWRKASHADRKAGLSGWSLSADFGSGEGEDSEPGGLEADFAGILVGGGTAEFGAVAEPELLREGFGLGFGVGGFQEEQVAEGDVGG